MAKLMLVEDDNNLREIYEARLQAEGYTIVSARDGEEALVVAKAEKPDLIISDVMMPKISGFEMLDILRNTEGLRDVKVIMLTALGQSDDQQRAHKLGADRYLVKSQVTLEDIVKVAHDLLEDQAGAAQPEAAELTAAPDPASAPAAAIPVAEPPASEPAPEAADVPAPDTQTQAQEEASVETKIENFVAGASEDPTPPPANPDPAPAADATAPDAPAAAPAVDPAPASLPEPPAPTGDDKLMDEAVKTLNDSVEEPAGKKPDHAASVPVAGKKVIQPIDPEPKKDIEELLAIEEAKESNSTGQAPASEGENEDPVDPHNIAL